MTVLNYAEQINKRQNIILYEWPRVVKDYDRILILFSTLEYNAKHIYLKDKKKFN